MRLAVLALAALLLPAADLVDADFPTKLVPKPVPYSVLLPDGYKDGPPLPLFLYLHGGGGDRRALAQVKARFEDLWASGKLPKMIVATPSVTPRCFYMDFKDGSEKWETLLVTEFRDFLYKTYNASPDPKKNFIGGVSMGGMGSLRMALKYPDRFGAVVALEPGIEPILRWQDLKPRHRFWREDSLFEAAFGKPVDPDYWARNNPATIAQTDAKRIAASGLQIYLDCGNDDMFLLHEGTEFLHRILWDNNLPHEYRSLHKADHVGRTLGPRLTEGFLFLERVLNPPPPDPQAQQTRKTLIEPAKKKWGIQ